MRRTDRAAGPSRRAPRGGNHRFGGRRHPSPVELVAIDAKKIGQSRLLTPQSGKCAMKDLVLKFLTYPQPLRLAIARTVIDRFSLFSYTDRLNIGAIRRPQYGYCIFQAAKLAHLLNYTKISVLEFGCGGGNGLLDAEMHISEVMKIFEVRIDLYGFDMGSGLPGPRDYRDLPYYFRPGSFEMDRQALERKLKYARLVVGDVKDTCRTFFEEYDAAPVGCMFHDLDFYSSTRDALTLLEAGASHFLPRTFMYFDDISGDDASLYNGFNGERLAIAEFNKSHQLKKIAKNHYLPYRYPNKPWAHDIFICHDFEHPRYNDFVAADEQRWIEASIQLR
jgi:hypothetical protein